MEKTSISTNINMDDSNCKTKICFGKITYFNVANKTKQKILKSQNKYISPLAMAIENKKDNEIVVKYDKLEKGKTSFIGINYLSLTYDELKKISWGVNNNLYEIITPQKPVKLYFDIDKRFVSEENDTLILNQLRNLVFDVLDIKLEDTDIYVCDGKGKKDGYIKSSCHIIVNDIVFKNMKELNKIIKHLQHKVITDNEYSELRNGVLDMKPYTKNQAFKLPYQSKVNQNIIQTPNKEEDKPNKIYDLSKYLISNSTNTNYFDTTNFEDINVNDKVITNKKDGTKIKCNFEEGCIIQQLINAVGKDYILPPIINYTKNDGLPYYLKSIPNNGNVPYQVFKTIGFCISKITNNSEEGLSLWVEWTKPYKILTNNDLRDDYNNHSIDKGYGWNLLYKMACYFNPKMKSNNDYYYPLFNDLPSYDVNTKIVNSRYLGNSINIENIVNDYDIINIKSPMGTGKSHDLKKIFNDPKYEKIIYFSCKRAFASCMIHDFEKYGFKNYLNIENKSDIKNIDRLICSVESIHYCNNEYDLVIIDESESITDNLMGEMFRKNKPIEGGNIIHDIITNSKKIMVMDAFLSTRSFDFIKDIIKDDINNKKSIYIKNNFKYPLRKWVDCDKEGFVNELKKKLKDKKRCVVVCGSKKMSDIIKIDTKEFNIKCYDSSNPLSLSCDVNTEWSECDLLIYTPTITAGISYDNLEANFDNLFIYCVNKNSAHFRDIAQAKQRVRKFNSNKIYICINEKFKGHNKEQMPLKKDEIIKYEDKFKSQLFNDEIKSVKDMGKLDYLYNIHIHNTLERNISQRLLRPLAIEYLKRENILIDDVSCFEGDDLFEDIEDWEYQNINDIDLETHSKYHEIINDKSIDNIKLDNDKVKEYVKFNYKHNQTNTNISDDNLKDFFNEYYSDKYERKHNGNLRNFKRMMSDIKYDYKNFNDYLINKNKGNDLEGKPRELFDMKLIRFQHLTKMFSELGIIKDNKIDIDNNFTGDDFKKLSPFYNNLDVKTINSMLSEKNCRFQKDENKNITTRQIQSIFNNLLREEFNMQIIKNGVVNVRLNNGKRKQLTKMKVINYIDSEKVKRNVLYKDIFSSRDMNKFNVFKDYDIPLEKVLQNNDDKPIKKTLKFKVKKYGKTDYSLNYFVNNSTLIEVKSIYDKGDITKSQYELILKNKKANE